MCSPQKHVLFLNVLHTLIYEACGEVLVWSIDVREPGIGD